MQTNQSNQILGWTGNDIFYKTRIQVTAKRLTIPEQYWIVYDLFMSKIKDLNNHYGIALSLGDEVIACPPIDTFVVDPSSDSILIKTQPLKLNVKLLAHGQIMYRRSDMAMIKCNSYSVCNPKAVNGVVIIEPNSEPLIVQYTLTFPSIIGAR